MSTILTDDEIDALELCSATKADIQDIEAAVLAKLAQQVPLAWQSWSYKNGYGYWGSKQEADRHSALDFEPVALYLHPAPQQADRQRVPEGWKLVPIEPTPESLAGAAVAVLNTASEKDLDLAKKAARIVLEKVNVPHGMSLDLIASSIATMAPAYRAMLAAAPEAPTQAEPMTEREVDEAATHAAANPAQADCQRVPEGWRLVPIQATVEMRTAGSHARKNSFDSPVGIWAAMLAAAPEAPAQEGGST